MPSPIRAAILTHAGGPHLDAYLTALAQCPEVEAVSIADASGATFAAAKKSLGAKLAETSKDAAALLTATKPALALVTMEAALAPPAIDAALDAGAHVFAEKPACVRASDFERLVQKAEAKHLHLMLALANRVTPSVQEARRVIQAGRLGKLYGVEIHLVADQTRLKSESYRRSWFASRARAGGGHLMWLGIHWLDLAMYLTGASIEQVAGFSGVVGGQPLEVDDSNALALRFDNGMFGTMTSGYYLERGYHQHIKIWGEKGWLWLSDQLDAPLRWQSSTEPKVAGVQEFKQPDEPRGYTPYVRAAARAAAGLAEPPITPREGLRVLDTIFAFYDAASAGQTRMVKRK
jgi:predicted dehydrogenase